MINPITLNKVDISIWKEVVLNNRLTSEKQMPLVKKKTPANTDLIVLEVIDTITTKVIVIRF